MTILKTIRVSVCVALGAMLFFLGASAYGQLPVPAPTSFANLPHPNGLAASLTNLFATSQDTNVVYSIDSSGTVTPFSTLPDANTTTKEIYLAISTGLGGFSSGDLFACMANKVYKVTSPTASVFHDFTSEGVTDSTMHHCGIVFDKVGTFGNTMIVTTEIGKVFKVSSTGTATLLVGPPAIFAAITEGPEVAPMAFTPAAGMLIVTQEENNTIWKIDGTGNATVFNNTLIFPESDHIVPVTVCSFAGGAFFSTAWDAGKILAFPASDFTGLSNDLLVPLEGLGTTQGIKLIDTSGTLKDFDVTAAVHEGSTFAQCVPSPPPPPKSHCTLTWGFYANHPDVVASLISSNGGTLKLGSVSYTTAQIEGILAQKAVAGNGLISLAHQLIAAKLNIIGGSVAPPSVVTAISQADALIGSMKIPGSGLTPLGFLSPAVTSGLETVLDNFNSGIIGPGHCNS